MISSCISMFNLLVKNVSMTSEFLTHQQQKCRTCGQRCRLLYCLKKTLPKGFGPNIVMENFGHVLPCSDSRGAMRKLTNHGSNLGIAPLLLLHRKPRRQYEFLNRYRCYRRYHRYHRYRCSASTGWEGLHRVASFHSATSTVWEGAAYTLLWSYRCPNCSPLCNTGPVDGSAIRNKTVLR